MDIRNVFPEMSDDINIFGELPKILTMEQFNYLSKNGNIVEYGFETGAGGVSHLRLQGLFTLEDVKKKIREICDKGE